MDKQPLQQQQLQQQQLLQLQQQLLQHVLTLPVKTEEHASSRMELRSANAKYHTAEIVVNVLQFT